MAVVVDDRGVVGSEPTGDEQACVEFACQGADPKFTDLRTVNIRYVHGDAVQVRLIPGALDTVGEQLSAVAEESTRDSERSLVQQFVPVHASFTRLTCTTGTRKWIPPELFVLGLLAISGGCTPERTRKHARSYQEARLNVTEHASGNSKAPVFEATGIRFRGPAEQREPATQPPTPLAPSPQFHFCFPGTGGRHVERNRSRNSTDTDRPVDAIITRPVDLIERT